MEIASRRNSLKQQLAGALAFTEVSLPEMKKRDSIASHDSDQSFTPVDDLLSGSSFRIHSRPRSKPSSNPERRVNIEQIPPVTPSKTESQIANTENEVPETNSMPRKQKRKKYKPKVVDDGASGKKSTKSVTGNSKSPNTPYLKDKNAKAPTTPDPRPQGPRVPVTPEPKLTNHGPPITAELKPTTLEAPHSPDSILQQIRAQITPDPKHSDRETPTALDLTCMESKVVVSLDEKSESTSLPNAVDSKPEKSEAPVTPEPKPDLKPLNWTGLRNNRENVMASTYPRLEKFSLEMQLNNDSVAQPTRSVRKRLNFGHEDTVPVRPEETTTGTNSDTNKPIIAISRSRDEVIKQLEPLREGLNSGSQAENKPVTQEEIASEKSGSPEKYFSITTSLNCPNMVKPVQLVANELNFDLGDKTEAVMHGALCAGMDSRLIQGETGTVKCPTEDVDCIRAKDYLIHLAKQRIRGVKRGRPKRSLKSNFDDMLEEIVSKMAHMKLHENALILYQEKKEKYRGIVALDEDSLIEWNLLMGEDDGANSAPAANPEREEKWQKERDSFRDLAEQFIAKMKLIQGSISN